MRIDYGANGAVSKAMSGMLLGAGALGLDPLLVELVKVRASQLNHCAYCLDMHTKDAVALGESDDRLHLVVAWRETPSFNERERAALAWTEELTLIADTGASDEVYESVRAVFSEEEMINLTIAIVAINSWNRFAVGFRSEPGHYSSRYTKVTA